MNDSIIIVDEQDRIVGHAEKMYVHINKLLHRAFSIFIFDWKEKKMLLQKRSINKYHSGGLWSNACCSHQLQGETMEDCLNFRMKEELGMSTHFRVNYPEDLPLLINGDDVIYSCGKFSYFASYGEVSENEIDHVYLYSPVYDAIDISNISFNKQEIEELKWITIEELKEWMKNDPEAFTAWFSPAFRLAYDVLCRQARNMDMFFNFAGQS